MAAVLKPPFRSVRPRAVDADHLPLCVIRAIADHGEEFPQDAVDTAYTIQNRVPGFIGSRQVLVVNDALQGVADVMIDFRYLPEVIHEPAVTFTRGQQEQERRKCRCHAHKSSTYHRLRKD